MQLSAEHDFMKAQPDSTTPSVSLLVYSQDGKNTGKAQLGMTVTFVPSISGTSNTAVTWSLQGAGSISSAGVYTAPATMPSNPKVTVTATLAASPTINVTYSMSLVNGVPSIAHAIPKPLLTAMTNSVTLQGIGFVAGMTVTSNGQKLPVTYQSDTSALLQIPVSATATGTLSLVATNPTPGGGASAAYPETIAVPTISLVAYSQDGTNTGNAQLGTTVTIVPNVQGTGNSALTWSLQGPGTISNTGVYTVPATMPSTTTATITATLTSNSAIKTTYKTALVNAVPAIAHAIPKPLNTGTTNAVTLQGSGFVSGMTLNANGKILPVTVQSSTAALVQIPVSATATGTMNLIAINPSPGGGSSTAYPETIAVPTISLVAYSQDGKNTGNAQLGTNVTIVPTVQGTGSTDLTWKLQGPGSLSSAGVYSVPATMPSTNTASATVSLTSNPAISTTYKMTLVNPMPTIYSANPNHLVATSTSVTFTGVGFVAGSTLSVNGKSVSTTFQSPTAISATIPASSAESGSLSIVVNNPGPGGGVSPAITLSAAVPGILSISPSSLKPGPYTLTLNGANFESYSQVYVNGVSVPFTYVSATQLKVSGTVAPWSSSPLSISVAYSGTASPTAAVTVAVSNSLASSYDAAARFSTQAAFGPNPTLVTHIQQIGLQGYLTEQFAEPVSTFTVSPATYHAKAEFFMHALTGSNLLRQRVAFALENFIAVAIPNDAASYAEGVPWQLIMEKDAFGNFRDLLTDVTMNSAMGVWLDLGNNWASTDPNVHPNQNYARELMQLFTMGPSELNDNGSVVTDSSGNPVPAYDDNTVFDLSRALTGWAMPPGDSTAFTDYGVDFNLPLQAQESQHDHGQKTLFGSVVLPAGQTIQQDLKSSLDAVFNRSSVAPFVSRLLIQHLVKSNPTPAYIQRITEVFKNNGSGVRGDLKAVVSAILLDPEARCGDTPSCISSSPNLPLEGHLQEPVLFLLSVLNGLQIQPMVAESTTLMQITAQLGQDVWRPSSVFSFYSPGYQIPGTKVVGPEFQLFDGNFATQRSQVLISILEGTQSGINQSYRSTDWLFNSFSSIPDILEAVNHMYYHGQMPSNTMSSITSYVQTLSGLENQQTTALYLALNSDSFQIAK